MQSPESIHLVVGVGECTPPSPFMHSAESIHLLGYRNKNVISVTYERSGDRTHEVCAVKASWRVMSIIHSVESIHILARLHASTSSAG